MKRKTSKSLVLNKETLRVLEDVSREGLQEVAGGSTGSYCCSACGNDEPSKSCCL